VAISTEPSTFEYARDWLVASECFVRDLMLRTEPTTDEARDAAKARIYNEEIPAEPNLEAEGETAPDLPPPVHGRPRALIEKVSDRRELAGTGTWRGTGRLEISVETPLPAAFRYLGEDSPTERAAKFNAFRTWCDQMLNTLRSELYAESGRGDGAGNPYLHATSIDVEAKPMDQEVQEIELFVGFTLGVDWR
jgi:hypothetical protein